MHFPFIDGSNIGAPLSNTCSRHTKQPSFRSRPPVPSPWQSLWVKRPWMMKVIISMSRCGWVPHGASNVNYGLLWVTSFKHQTLENLGILDVKNVKAWISSIYGLSVQS